MKYTLAQAVDKYYITKSINKKKYFATDLIRGGDVLAELNVNTLNVVKSVWLPLHEHSEYPFVEIPEDCERVYALSVEDSCKDAVPLFFDKMFHVEHSPIKRACGCSGLTDEVEALTMTTKFIFNNGGIDYYEKKWIKVCENGDILEYREVPVKQFNDRIGDAGDFSNDHNNDFSGGDGFSNYEIVTQIITDKKCSLELKPCGCPKDTAQNEQLLMDHCGNYLNPILNCSKKRCSSFLPEINPNRVGEATISDCETKIHVRKLRKHVDFLLLTYQTNGRYCVAENCVPEKILMALWMGINWRKIMLSDKYSLDQKREAKAMYKSAVNDLILFNNKLSLKMLSNVQDTKILW